MFLHRTLAVVMGDIARSFALSYRTAKKIVKVKGDNCFYQKRKADCMLTFGKISWTQKLAL